MHFKVEHSTTYTYAQAASSSQSLVHLRPLHHARQRLRAYRLAVDPAPELISERIDYFGNCEQRVEVRGRHSVLNITSYSDLETLPVQDIEPERFAPWETMVAPGRVHTALDVMAAEVALESPLVPVSSDYASIARQFFTPGRPIFQAALDFNTYVHRHFTYKPGATNVSTPVEDVIRLRVGVCQDFAHVALACLRSLGLSARYVSGYVETSTPSGAPHLEGSAASHAWISLRVSDSQWIDFDPTNDCLAGERHITVAHGRDFGDVSPIKGVIVGGAGQEVTVGVSVLRQGPSLPQVQSQSQS